MDEEGIELLDFLLSLSHILLRHKPCRIHVLIFHSNFGGPLQELKSQHRVPPIFVMAQLLEFLSSKLTFHTLVCD